MTRPGILETDTREEGAAPIVGNYNSGDETPPAILGNYNSAPDPVARSVAILEAVGFHLVPLAAPIAGTWDLLAASPRGLTLIAARDEPPNLVGHAYGLPPGFPPTTVRLILTWPPDALLPTPITL